MVPRAAAGLTAGSASLIVSQRQTSLRGPPRDTGVLTPKCPCLLSSSPCHTVA